MIEKNAESLLIKNGIMINIAIENFRAISQKRMNVQNVESNLLIQIQCIDI